MPYDKLVDSTQLDADLTSVANAIRAKSGSSGSLAFPAGFVSEIGNISGGGGDPYAIAQSILDGSITEYVDPALTELRHSAFRNCNQLTKLQVHGVTKVGPNCIENTKITALALPSLSSMPGSGYGSVATLLTLDYGVNAPSVGTSSLPFANLQTLILRRTASLVGAAASSLNTTPMKNGGAGCTVYIPKALYDHLGDGTSLDYKSATTWSTYDAYGTITWAQIEGSIYETQYADGTPIT